MGPAVLRRPGEGTGKRRGAGHTGPMRIYIPATAADLSAPEICRPHPGEVRPSQGIQDAQPRLDGDGAGGSPGSRTDHGNTIGAVNPHRAV